MNKLLSYLLVIVFISTGLLAAAGCTSNDDSQLSLQLDSQLKETQSRLAAAQSELSQAQTDFNASKASLEAANKKVAELEAKATPRYFKDPVELANWLAKDPVSEEPNALTYVGWYQKALRVQQNAIKDGFLISVQYHFCDERQVIEYIACLALINGYLFMWDPENDDVVADPYWGKVG